MRETDIPRFSEVMIGLSEVYGRKFTEAAMDIYFNAFGQYDVETVISAISAHVKSPDNGQFFPKPADIIRMIGGSSKDMSFIAWTKVDKAVRKVGIYESVVFDDEIIHIVIHDMGGWPSLGEKQDSEWPFIAKEFMERYQACKSRQQVRSDYPKQLIGLHEANNNRKGFKVVNPVLIGDASAAKKVLLGGAAKTMIGFERL